MGLKNKRKGEKVPTVTLEREKNNRIKQRIRERQTWIETSPPENDKTCITQVL